MSAVASSGGEKTYDVEWADDDRTIAANDNASYWQGYVGYPIVAVLLERGVLRADRAVVELISGVPWPDLRQRFRRDYAAAVAQVLDGLQVAGADPAPVERAVDDVLAQLEALGLRRAGRGRRPPKGSG